MMSRECPLGTLEAVLQAVSEWEEAVGWIARGWDCLDEYTHDLYFREMLDDAIAEYPESLPSEVVERVATADQRFRDVSFEIEKSVWSSGYAVDPQRYNPVQHWYYFRWLYDGIGKL